MECEADRRSDKGEFVGALGLDTKMPHFRARRYEKISYAYIILSSRSETADGGEVSEPSRTEIRYDAYTELIDTRGRVPARDSASPFV